MIALNRRFFCFGAAATLVLPPPRTFHFLPKHMLGLTIDQMARIITVFDEQQALANRWIVVDADRMKMLLTADGK